MEKDAEKIFCELKEDVSAYVELKYRLLKLNATERIARFTAVLLVGVIFVLLIFFTILFLFFSLGFFLGAWFGSTALGFLLVGGVSLALLFVLLLSKDKIRKKIMNLTIRTIWAGEEECED